MDIKLVLLVLLLIPIIVAGGIVAAGIQMTTLYVVLLGGVMIYLAYNLYARRVDRDVIKSDAKKATPAKMYMDGVDFMPTSRNVLYGYHFKSVAAAGPIVGVITAANIWGWLPSILWLILGVTFIGWAADYSAIMLSVRNEGNSLSAVAYRLIAPRTRTILFVFIFFYLLLVAGAFAGIMTALLASRPDVPFGILMLAVMGLAAGHMMYKMKMDLIVVTAIVVIVTLAAMLLGPFGVDLTKSPVDWSQGPISGIVTSINKSVDSLSGGQALLVTVDPTNADPRVPAPVGTPPARPKTAVYDPATGNISMLPSYVLWAVFILVFSYLGANLPIWRYAQPVNYIGFWITLLAIGLSAIGAVLAPFTAPATAVFQSKVFTEFAPKVGSQLFPLWPMLFVTIACGAISGWHSLIGSVGTSRQLEYETDALPVGGGAMMGENALALLSLTAVSIAGGAGAGAFAAGIGKLLGVLFGAASVPFGTALGFGTFMVIVLTVTQLLFRVMRVTFTEWLGEAIPAIKNPHVSTIVGMVLTLFLVLTGTWVYLWFSFGAANQLLAALSLLIVAVWLRSTGRNPAFAAIPMLFMFITTEAAFLMTAYNLYQQALTVPAFASQPIVAIGAWSIIVVDILLFIAALFIGYDGWKAWQRYGKVAGKAVTAPTE